MSKQFNPVTWGSEGEDVIVLQSFFRAMQYRDADGKAIEIDGYAGKSTVHCINIFQETQRAYGYECGTNGKNDDTFGASCWARLLGV